MGIKYHGKEGLEIEIDGNDIGLSINGVHAGLVRGNYIIDELTIPGLQYIIIEHYAAFPLLNGQPDRKVNNDGD